MSYIDRGDSDWDRYEMFAESRDLDPADETLQEAYFEYIFEWDGHLDRYNEANVEAFIAFLDAIEYEYNDIDEVIDRYSDT